MTTTIPGDALVHDRDLYVGGASVPATGGASFASVLNDHANSKESMRAAV